MQWSHSSLKQYENCPRQYHEIKVLKNYKKSDTEQTLYGKELHRAAENYVKNGVALPPQFLFMQPTLDALLSKGGRKYAEHELALTKELEPCEWDEEDAWVRGIIDLLILDDDDQTAWIVDYKTGNAKHADKGQLDLMSLLVFAHYPSIKHINSALIFVVKDVLIKHKRNREDIEKLWWDYRQRVARIEAAMETGVWNPTQSGLCRKYCDVLSCEFNGRAI